MSSSRHAWSAGLAAGALLILSPSLLAADEAASRWEPVWRLVQLRDYNTRVVLLGTMLLGLCGGIVGVFTLLRKRSLIGDVVGHSALPGIAIAFILTQIVDPGSGKNVPVLMAGAFAAGLTGAVSVLIIDRFSKIKPDAALAIVLSLFYGLGTALLTVITRFPTASAAGLKDYLNGKTASLIGTDVWIFTGTAALLAVVTLLLFKELSLLCFDDAFAAATGWPVFWLDSLLIMLVAGVTIVGMQTVGLILVVAILVIPAAAARFWTDNLKLLAWVSAAIGAAAAGMGTVVSALAPRLATGAMIVLCGSTLFLVSLVLGAQRGLFWRWREFRRVQERIGRHDLLRAAYEVVEAAAPDNDISEPRLLESRLSIEQLLQRRRWSRTRVRQLIRQAQRAELLESNPDGTCSLTADGAALARRAVRNHRLWELYLINYADIAPSHVDCDADRLEHILSPDLIRELEQRLRATGDAALPASPHSLAPDPPPASNPPGASC